AVRPGHYIIRAVEFLSFIVVSQYSVFPVRSQGDDGAQNAGAVNQSMLLVVSVAIRIAQRNQLLLATIQEDPINLVLNFVTDIDEAGRVPDRTLGEDENTRNLSQLRIVIKHFSED